MAIPKPKSPTGLTYADYAHDGDEGRFEIIHGTLYAMSPAPSTQHQRIAGELFRQFANHLRGKPCEAFVAPFDVRFPEADEADDEVRTVVQPDIAVVCDPGKLDEKGCRGAPDLVIEILSPSTAPNDWVLKRELYERRGVREYWIIEPREPIVTRFNLDHEGCYSEVEVWQHQREIPSAVLEGLVLDFTGLYTEAQLSTRAKESPVRYGLRGARQRAAACRGFTLVELLVVIAVISILAGLLLPALQQAHDSVVRVSCMNQMRQQGTCFALYADDYDGWWPFLHDRAGHASQLAYNRIEPRDELVQDYSQGSYDVWVCPDGRKWDGDPWDTSQDYLESTGGGYYYAGLSCEFTVSWVMNDEPYNYLADGQVMRWFVDPPDSGYAFRTLAAMDGQVWKWSVLAARDTKLSRASSVGGQVIAGEISQCDRWHQATGWNGPGGAMRHGAGRSSTWTGGNVLYADGAVAWCDIAKGFGCVTDSSKLRIGYFLSVPFINWYKHNGSTINLMPPGWDDYQQYYESY